MNITHILYEYQITVSDACALIKMGKIERGLTMLEELETQITNDYMEAVNQ